MSGTVVLIVWIGFSIGVWVLYHKIFTVYYFSLSQGLMKEFFMSFIVGLVLTGLTLTFWWLVALILVGAGFLFSGKVDNPSGKKAVRVAFIVAAVVISIVGISYSAKKDSQGTSGARGWSTGECILCEAPEHREILDQMDS